MITREHSYWIWIIEPSHLISKANQMAGFYMQCKLCESKFANQIKDLYTGTDLAESCMKDYMIIYFLDCPKMYFQDCQKINFFLDIFFKFWNGDLIILDKLSLCLKNKWQKSEKQLRKRYSIRTDFVSLLLEILLGSF